MGCIHRAWLRKIAHILITCSHHSSGYKRPPQRAHLTLVQSANSSKMSKPVFVFVPGAWHAPDVFSPVMEQLDAAGYNSVGVTLPSVGAEAPLKDFEPDVEAVRTALSKVLDSGDDVVLVMHSYGSIPACEATKGMSGKGKIRRLVFCCAFVLPEGSSLLDALGGQPGTWIIVDVMYASKM